MTTSDTGCAIFCRPLARAAWGLALSLLLVPAAAAHAPHDVVNELGVSPSFSADGTVFASFSLTDHTLFGRSTDGGQTWQQYGLPMMKRPLLEFAFSPRFKDDATAFVATEGGGVWKTTDGGLTWQAASAGLSNLYVRGIAVSPNYATDQLVVAATDGGCFRSTDGGQSWNTIVVGLVETSLRVVRFSPANASTVFIGGKTLHASADGGLTWQPRTTFDNLMETLALSPKYGVDKTLMVAFGRCGDGARFSTDGGNSFSGCNSGLTDQYVYELSIGDNGTVFAATKTAGCYRAPAPGGKWNLAVDGFEIPSDLTDTHNTEAITSPRFSTDGTVFIGAYEGLYVSHDFGATWRQSDVYNQHLNRHIAFSPDFVHDDTVFFGNYGGGVLQYTMYGNPALPGPSLATSLTLGVGGGLGSTAHSGLEGTATANGDQLLGSPWKGRSSNIAALYSDALALSPAFATDHTMFYGYTVLCRSTDAGVHWTPLAKPGNVSVVRRIATSTDFASDHTVIFGTGGQGTWLSVDSGESFTQIQGGLPANLVTSSIHFSPDYAGDGTVFIGSPNSSVYRSTDHAQTWAPSNSGIAIMAVRCLTLSPDFAEDRTAFAGTVGAGLFVTHDAGVSWAPANSGLPETGVSQGNTLIIESVVLSPDFASDGIAFVATLNDSVFRSLDGGSTWQPASTGLPIDSVRTLDISPDFTRDHLVMAGTYGWSYQTVDGGAHWTKLPGGIRVDETAATVYRNGNWGKVGGKDNNGGSVQFTFNPNAWEETQFFGDRIVWFANTGSFSGIARVTIDGGPPVDIDLYRPTLNIQEPVFDEHFAAPGWHVIRVTSTGLKNPAAKFARVDSDGYFYAF